MSLTGIYETDELCMLPLEHEDLLTLKQTSKIFLNVLNNEGFWRKKLLQEVGCIEVSGMEYLAPSQKYQMLKKLNFGASAYLYINCIEYRNAYLELTDKIKDENIKKKTYEILNLGCTVCAYFVISEDVTTDIFSNVLFETISKGFVFKNLKISELISWQPFLFESDNYNGYNMDLNTTINFYLYRKPKDSKFSFIFEFYYTDNHNIGLLMHYQKEISFELTKALIKSLVINVPHYFSDYN